MNKLLNHAWLVMRITTFLLIVGCLHLSAKGLSQTVTLSVKDESLFEVLQAIKEQTGYVAFSDEATFQKAHPVTLTVNASPIGQTLQQLFRDQPLTYELDGKTILIKEKEKSVLEKAHQQNNVTGIVTDTTGAPLPGVTVMIKGTSTATFTGPDGTYRIVVPGPESILIFRMIGFEVEERPVSSYSTIDISLKPSISELDEVVVVGYGEVRRGDLTGAVSSFSPEENQGSQYHSVDALMQGRMAGVQVGVNNGEPGGTMSVRIRGTNSLRDDNEPLYVVDGVIMNSATENVPTATPAGSSDIQSPQNALTGINPRDIESIEVLKDASATALYGSRGANGVVLITTRQGSGASKVNFHSTTDLGFFSQKAPVLDGLDYAYYQNELQEISGRNPIFDIDAQGNIREYLSPEDLEEDPDRMAREYQPVDWQDEMARTAITQNHRLTISGSTDKTSYLVAAGYLNQRGLIEQTGLQEGDLRVNLNHQVSDRFSVDTRISTAYRSNAMTQGTDWSGDVTSSMIRRMISAPPLRGYFDAADDFDETVDEEEMANLQGPNIWLREYDDNSNEFRMIGVVNLKYKLSGIFTYELRTGLNIRNQERKRWYGTGLARGRNVNGAASLSTGKRYRYNIDNMLHFDKRFNKIHRINGTVAVILDESHDQTGNVQGSDFSTDALRADGIGLAGLLYAYGHGKDKQSLLSGLGRLNYTLKNKYLFTFSFRADGSSKFAKGNKYSFFPAAAFAWRIGDEAFMQNISWLSDLKFRISYGRTGSQAISAYRTFSPYSYAAYPGEDELQVGVRPTSLANPDLIWETTEQYNAGLDFGFLNDRLYGSVEVYNKITSNLLQNSFQIPPSVGFTTMAVNIGEMGNKGLEVTLNGLLSDNEQFRWELGGNISFNRNKIRNLGLQPGGFGSQELVAFMGQNIANSSAFRMPANIFIEGQPIGLFWGFQTHGVIPNEQALKEAPAFRGSQVVPGDIWFADQNGDGNIDDLDLVVIGDPNPKFTYGVNTSLGFRNFSLDLLISGVYGNQIANGTAMWEVPHTSQVYRNVRRENYETAWRPEAPDSDFSRLDLPAEQANVFKDRNVEDGSFMRLSYVTLGYDLPVSKLSFIEGLNVYVTGRNLLTFTRYSGYDPEVNSFAFNARRIGVDWQSYPNVSSFLLGLNVTF